MGDGVKLLLTLPDATLAQANAEVSDLQHCVERAAADRATLGALSFTILKESADTQDLGTVLGITITGPAAVAIAAGIQTFIAKRGSRVRIYDEDRNVLVEAVGAGAENIDVAQTIEAYRKAR